MKETKKEKITGILMAFKDEYGNIYGSTYDDLPRDVYIEKAEKMICEIIRKSLPSTKQMDRLFNSLHVEMNDNIVADLRNQFIPIYNKIMKMKTDFK